MALIKERSYFHIFEDHFRIENLERSIIETLQLIVVELEVPAMNF